MEHVITRHHPNLSRSAVTAGILLPVVVPPIRERFYKPEVRNPPPFKQVRAPLTSVCSSQPSDPQWPGSGSGLGYSVIPELLLCALCAFWP